MNNYFIKGDTQAGLQILKEVDDEHHQLSFQSLRYLLPLTIANKSSVAWSLKQFNKIEHLYFPKEDKYNIKIIFSTMLQYYYKIGDIKTLVETFQIMLQRRIAPFPNTVEILVNGYISVGLIDKALETLDEMRKQGWPATVLSLGNTPILGEFIKQKKLDRALEMKKQMDNAQIPLTTVDYNILLIGLINASNLQLAQDLKREMEQRAIMPDIITYNTFFQEYAKMGDYQKVMELKGEMEERNVEMDMRSYFFFIKAALKHGDQSTAFFTEMKAKNIKPSFSIYHLMISTLVKKKKIMKAVSVFQEMKLEQQNQVLEKFFTAMVLGLVKEGELEAAKKLFENAERDRIILFDALSEYGHYELADEVADSDP